jgi:membrane associated rhomboid family serine protease
MGDRDYFRKDYMRPKSVFQPGADNAIVSLIIVNLVVFTLIFGLWLIYLVVYDTESAAHRPFSSELLGNLFVPASGKDFIVKPWTALTYMFSQFGFWRLFSSMLWLWAFGQIFQLIAGSDKVFPVYIYCGLAGAVYFVLSSFVFHNNLAPELAGAGAAIMGLAIAATVLSPGYRLFPMIGNGIPLWILTAVFVIIDLGTISSFSNTMAAHIAAGLMGYIYVVLLKQGKDTGAWMNRFAAWLMDLFNPEKKYRSQENKTLFYQAKKDPYTKKPNLTQQKLDEILDKINQRGYESLSDDEKEFLRKASEHL